MGFSFVSWIVMMSIYVLSVRFFSSCIFVVSPLMFICIIFMVFLEFICCWVWLVNIQILLHIIVVVCKLMVLVSNRVVLLVVNVAFPCRGVVSVASQGCTMFVHPV